MEDAKTPAGSAGQERPRRRFGAEEARPPAPRKAKRLEWKSIASTHKQTKKDG
ncbi:Ribose 5-phosphate isomerase B [Bacillus badius]|nr:Ribose 5-phosphate isomerase B [Bacillus badius]